MTQDNDIPRSRPARGRVWIVGAGPGDPGLITVRGHDCLVAADAVLYDALVNPALLALARSDADLRPVGKRAGAHEFRQAQINALMVRLARAGKRVCRLKGGDPFVFGRGGEEAIYLRRHGIPFEIVPGVSAAIAAPAYAGIPVTHRGCAHTLTLVTGHESPGRGEAGIPWEHIARTGGTLVVLMGVRNLAHVVAALLEKGTAGNTPAAIVADGSLPRQRVVSGTLDRIVGTAQRAGIGAPALLIVGEVVRLRTRLAWFEHAGTAPASEIGRGTP